MENQRLLLPQDHQEFVETNSEEDDWTDDGSTYSSYYSDSDSTIPDWEPYVNDLTGDLLYIDCHPFVTQNKEVNKNKENSLQLAKTQLRKSTRSKFLRLIRLRESKRRSRKGYKPPDLNETTSTSKVKFQDSQEGEEKEVILEIDPENRHNLSSDKSLAESLFGLIVSTLSDGNRVMISGFSFDSKAKHHRNIKIGDWLKSINNIEINVQNLDDTLQKFINRHEVLLKLQRVAGIDVTKDPPINKLNLESNFVKELLNSNCEDDQILLETLCEHPVGVVYINTALLSEEKQEDVLYSFPRTQQKNILCKSRGIYITLHHLLTDITKSIPKSTMLLHKQGIVHVVYTSFKKNLLLFMLPDTRASVKETIKINNEIVRLLEFTYKTVDECFTEKNLNQVDSFFQRFFARILCNEQWATTGRFVELQSLSPNMQEASPYHFEDVLPAVPYLQLTDEAQMQLEDALAEFEASDYRDWNEDPLDCQRLFTILGSAIYHSGYLLATHFIHEDLVDVHCFLRQQGLLHLSKTEPVKSLVLWKEVFPWSCNRGSEVVQDGRRYLLVVGSQKGLLATIMEAGGCTEPPEDLNGPDAFYVEEAQATLAHIQELGIGELTDRFIGTNPGPQITLPIATASKKREGLGFSPKTGFSTSPLVFSKEIGAFPKKSEVTSILKRRSLDPTNVQQGNSVASSQDDSYDAQSEESGSQGYHERMSEISDDDKMASKRKFRSQEYSDESDMEDYRDGSQISNSSFDISEIRHSLLSEVEDFRPRQLTVGPENILFHFVLLDTYEGILLSPPECQTQCRTYNQIVNNFRRCCMKMNTLFQNTLRFKNMPAQEVAKSVLNKSLIAIKEHGVVFDCPSIDDKDSNSKKNKLSYWVVGRLFYTPYPRELYVCYKDGIPQNLVEFAFKLNMGWMA